MAAQAAAVLRDKRKRIAAEEKKRDGEDSGSPDPAGRVIPVGPGGVRQLPQQSGRRRNRVDGGLHQNPDGSFESGGSANVILYVGLGMISVGLVITFVGLGEKGFKTLELKLIGPSLVGCGVFFALLRVLFCTVPTCARGCIKRFHKTEDAEKLLSTDKDKLREASVSRKKNGVGHGHPQEGTRPNHGAQHGNPIEAARQNNGGRHGHPIEAARTPQRVDHVERRAPRRVEETRREETSIRREHRRQPPLTPLSDSEEEVEVARPRIKPVRQKGRLQANGGRGVNVEPGGRKEDRDDLSTSSSSGISGILTPHLEGSTKNLRTGEIILNATRLNGDPS